MHPNHLLVADRARINVVDCRASKTSSLLGLGLKMGELVRGVKEGRSSHLVYSATDSRIVLSDLRQTNSPLLALEHEIAGRDRAPVLGLALGGVDGEDWSLAYTRWGELSVSVVDWQHSLCSSWRAVDEEALSLLCTKGPSILGRQSSVLRGWSSSVQQARNLGGAWLDTHVEERVAVPFTGADVVKEKDGSVVVYMSNALGDLFAKQLVRRDDEEDEEDSSILEEVVIKREETWMEEWGELVEECALLPRVKLMADTQQVMKKHGYSKQQWTLPKAARTKAQEKKQKGEHLLPRISRVELSRVGNQLEGSKGENLRKALNAAYLDQFGSHGCSNKEERTQKAEMKDKFVAGISREEQVERCRVKRKDSLGISGPKSFRAKCFKKEGKEKAWKQLAGIEDVDEETGGEGEGEEDGEGGGEGKGEGEETGKVSFLKQFPVVSLDQYLPGKGANRHTEAMLQVLLSQDDVSQKAEEAAISSRRTSGVGLSDVAAPPKESDPFYPMDTFWDDLGVGAPISNQTEINQQQDEEDDEDLYQL